MGAFLGVDFPFFAKPSGVPFVQTQSVIATQRILMISGVSACMVWKLVRNTRSYKCSKKWVVCSLFITGPLISEKCIALPESFNRLAMAFKLSSAQTSVSFTAEHWDNTCFKLGRAAT